MVNVGFVIRLVIDRIASEHDAHTHIRAVTGTGKPRNLKNKHILIRIDMAFSISTAPSTRTASSEKKKMITKQKMQMRKRRSSTCTTRMSKTDEDGYWIPGPFLRPEGSPKAEGYTGKTVWKLMQKELVEVGLEQITPTSAKDMTETQGWTLLDVRPYPDYCKRHCWGAVNAQYYVGMDAKDPKNWGKAALSAMIFPERVGGAYLNVTENENFLDEVLESVEWGSKLIVYDDVGGVIGEEGVDFENGVQTPSLMAIYELAARGWGSENLIHMAGGLVFWDEVDRFDCGEVSEEDEDE